MSIIKIEKYVYNDDYIYKILYNVVRIDILIIPLILIK